MRGGLSARSENDRTSAEPVTVSGDRTGGDLSSPSKVERADGTLLTVRRRPFRTDPAPAP